MKINSFILVLFIASVSFSQNKPKELLFTIDNQQYFSDEFLRVYNKNIDLVKDESQKDLNKYMDLFVGYKLKINKANKLGLQNNQKYIDELKSYRTQLSKNYTSDIKVTKALIDEAYNRLQKEVKASHILINVDENANAQDTLAAYNKILEVRQKALKGANFEDLATQFSQDPSAKDNKGNLGFFSAFRMVYPFENAAFNTKKGDVSLPFRTKFGYHIVKVNEIRDNRGDITVAHIMVLKKQAKDGAVVDNAGQIVTINDIYKKLKQGEKFENLATQFSEDKNSAPKGGVLPRFSSGQLSSEEFENKAFTLISTNDFSEPFETQFGWHIVKLVEKHPVKKLDEMEKELDAKIRKDDRARLITNYLTTKLRAKYKIVKNEVAYNKVKNVVTDAFYDGNWKQPENLKDFDQTLFKIEELPIKQNSFLSELSAQQKSSLKVKPIGRLVDVVFNNFVDNQITNYYNDNLEKEFPEFANIVEEYRDGLLLFDLMEKEIWEKAKTDSIGLKKFFLDNQAKYQWKKRAEINIVSSTNKDVITKAKSMLSKDIKDEALKSAFNTKDVVNVMTKTEMVEEGTEAAKKITFKKGVSEIYNVTESFLVNKVTKILPAGPKKLDEVKGKVINDYQQYLEDNWVNNLKQEFKVNINQVVFEKLKSTIKN